MRKSSDIVLDRARVREVAGVFYTFDAMEAAGKALLLAGYDRSDIDVIAAPEEVRKKLGPKYAAIPAVDLADIPGVPRQPFIAGEDMSVIKAVFAGTFGGFVALMVALIMISSGDTSARIGMWSAVLGLTAAGVGHLAAQRLFGQDKIKGTQLILWVRANSDERQEQAREILIAHGASAVRIHEIEIAKTIDDLPLSSLRPDPWLGNERLGQP